MNLLDYYKGMQSNKAWYNKFQSTSNKQSGKTFYYINTNFRTLLSFITQFKAFLPNVGLDRSEWEKFSNGQEADKHRVANLVNANLFQNNDNKYIYTSKGLTLKDWIEINNMTDSQSWIILFLLILDYKSEFRNLDIVRTANEMLNLFKASNFKLEYIQNELFKCLKISDKIKMFESDAFWLISFARDKNFLDIFYNSSELEKENIKSYVVACSKSNKSSDLIAHKFISGGAYQVSTFNDDVKTLYFLNITIANLDQEFDNYIANLLNDYSIIFDCNIETVKKFIHDHKSVFKMVYNNVKNGGINNAN